MGTPINPENPPLKYLYIAGMPHSGSTLLAFLTNAHPEIATVGEADFVDKSLPHRWDTHRGKCSCGLSYFNCPFWNRVLTGMAVRGYGIGAPTFYDRSRKRKGTIDGKLHAFASAALDISGASVFLDASKDPGLLPALTNNPLIDLHVLDLYRDGRGIINSWRKRNSNKSIGNLTMRWVYREKKRQNDIKNVPVAKRHRVHYEKLAQHPDDVMRGIFTFIGVDPEVQVSTGYKTAAEHHIVGNPMRLKDNETIRFDEKWRKLWDDGMLAQFNRFFGESINARNGYPLND